MTAEEVAKAEREKQVTLVLASQSRDPKDDEIPDGDFERAALGRLSRGGEQRM